jgi:Domain of unknown function (DUF6602)
VTLQPPQATPEEIEGLTTAFDLRAGFESRQRALVEDLNVTANFTSHGTTIGDAHEADWVAMLRSWLPNRYGVGPIFAVDANGRQSQQIDVGIYDRHYAPSWFETKRGVQFVPAESVYAVFEVKPEINKTYADYTGDKIASVRALRRTNGSFRHFGGVSEDQDLTTKPILGGILTVRSRDHDRVEPRRPVGNPSGEGGLRAGGEVPDMNTTMIKVEVERLGVAVAEGE